MANSYNGSNRRSYSSSFDFDGYNQAKQSGKVDSSQGDDNAAYHRVVKQGDKYVLMPVYDTDYTVEKRDGYSVIRHNNNNNISSEQPQQKKDYKPLIAVAVAVLFCGIVFLKK